MSKRALVVGNSDGIGLEVTRRLLRDGWAVEGISRSASPLGDTSPKYRHHTLDVRAPDYLPTLRAWTAAGTPDLCVYCAGVGEPLDLDALETSLAEDAVTFEVNTLGAVRLFQAVAPAMVDRGEGHIVVLSSLADGLINPGAPAYSASKAGLSSYAEGMALALKPRGVKVTNVRFGFVDTKMAKGAWTPMKMSVESAAARVMRAVARRPMRVTTPWAMAAMLLVLQSAMVVRVWLG